MKTSHRFENLHDRTAAGRHYQSHDRAETILDVSLFGNGPFGGTAGNPAGFVGGYSPEGGDQLKEIDGDGAMTVVCRNQRAAGTLAVAELRPLCWLELMRMRNNFEGILIDVGDESLFLSSDEGKIIFIA